MEEQKKYFIKDLLRAIEDRRVFEQKKKKLMKRGDKKRKDKNDIEGDQE